MLSHMQYLLFSYMLVFCMNQRQVNTKSPVSKWGAELSGEQLEQVPFHWLEGKAELLAAFFLAAFTAQLAGSAAASQLA